MDGLEISEVFLSQIDLGDRYDAEYYTKNYIHISQQMEKVNHVKLGKLATMVASAFYPAATHLYSIGDTPFVRCVDCIEYPIITDAQDKLFEKIPYVFAENCKGISVLQNEDIIITKVGTPCYASIIKGYDEVALSRTVLGLTNILNVDPYYLMVFLRSKYGFEQLFRQRELTIQYQLTLARVKNVDIFMPDADFQKEIRRITLKYIEKLELSREKYASAEKKLLSIIDIKEIEEKENYDIKLFSESFKLTGRLDAEYYQLKYDVFFDKLKKFNVKHLGGKDGLVKIKKSIEPGSDSYQDEGIPFIRVGDITYKGISSSEIHLPYNIVNNVEDLYPKKDTILFSKDGSVGIAYKLEKDENIITSGALLHLIVKNQLEILPDYLALVLNSSIVKLQAERDANGAIIQHWKISDIENVLIPVLSYDIQRDIAQNVQESFTLLHEAEKEFAQAKKAVEIAVEKGEEESLKWLKRK